MLEHIIIGSAVYAAVLLALWLLSRRQPASTGPSDSFSEPLSPAALPALALFFWVTLVLAPAVIANLSDRPAVLACETEWDGRFNGTSC